jgi:hypothetical protein
MSDQREVEPCSGCGEGWREVGQAFCDICYEGQIADLTKANQILQALIGNRDKDVDSLRAQLASARKALEKMLVDPPSTLDEPDQDFEVIVKMREIAKAALTDEKGK